MDQSKDTPTNEIESPPSVNNSKVARVIEEYGLSGFGTELEHHWTGQREPQYSLRQLADHLNYHILQSAMEQVGMHVLEGEAENTYRLLTDDDVSRGMRTQTQKALDREGVDIERLTSDFVSHQAVHTYLTKFRHVRPRTDDDTDYVEKAAQSIQRLQSRTVAVTATTIDRLKNSERIDIGNFEVLVDIRIVCHDCDTYITVRDLFRDKGCQCE